MPFLSLHLWQEKSFSFPLFFSCLDYKSLGILKRQFPNTPLIGLTATATNHVLKDAQSILHVQKCITFTASFNRPNLYYEVGPATWFVLLCCLLQGEGQAAGSDGFNLLENMSYELFCCAVFSLWPQVCLLFFGGESLQLCFGLYFSMDF